MNSPGERPRTAPWLCAGSLALSAAMSARLAFGGASGGASSGYALAAAAFGLAAALALRYTRGRLAGPLVALASLNLVTAVPELGLRSAGFRYVSGIEFGYPEPEVFWELEPDGELFWKLPAGMANRLGFLGPDPATPKPPGTFRWMVLGDSCAQRGHPDSWPELAARELAGDVPGLDLVNLALSGYSSHQGGVLVARHAAELEPDLVTVAYGWNDHWLARGAVDSEKRIDARQERLYRASALLQAARKLAVSAGWIGEGGPPLERLRVPPEQYRRNLTRIVTDLRARGARVVLLTAPAGYERLGVPDYIVENQFAESKQAAVERHAAYNEIAREVARSTGASLLDLAAEIDAREDVERLFLHDRIHLNETGRAEIARRFAAFVRSELAALPASGEGTSR